MFVPEPDDRLLAFPAEHRQAGRVECEQCAAFGRKADPSRGQHAQLMAVPEHGGDAVEGDQPRDDVIGAPTHVCCGLAARTAVRPDRPAGPVLADLRRRTALVVAVVPLTKIVDDLRVRGETGELARHPGALQRAREDEVEPPVGQPPPELLGRRPTGFGQRHVGRAGVPAGRAPLRLAVSDKPDLGRCHGTYDARMHTDITVYGTNWCSDCKRAKQFFGEQRVHYDFVDIDGDAEALAYVEQVNEGKQVIPVIRFGDGSILVEPSNVELAEKLGLKTSAKRHFYDLIVVGSGPAGLTAALYAAREGLDTLVVERAGVGGQAGVTELLDNFPGFPEGVSGAEFADRLRAQAERFGVEILQAQEVTGLKVEGRYRCVMTGAGEQYQAGAVLLALGSTYRRLGVAGEEDFIGAGVHFCATCDGAFYRGKEVLVVGGGNSAGEESIFLTKFASKATIVTRDDALTASKVVQEKVAENEQIEVLTHTSPSEFRGDSRLRSVVLRDTHSGEEREVTPDGVFVFIGLSPNTELVKDVIQLDDFGFVQTDMGLQTSMPGVFAAGDVRAGSTKQAASAAGEGAAAALAIRRFLESQMLDEPEVEVPVQVGGRETVAS